MITKNIYFIFLLFISFSFNFLCVYYTPELLVFLFFLDINYFFFFFFFF